ncbi:hypothetical protein CsSME_00009008 [Camellia sinensis var. sinensis]
MDCDQTSLEDKVLSENSFPTDGANCTGSKYSGKPVLLSSELRRCPITCEQVTVSYPAVCGRKNPPTVKLAHTLGWIERRERVFECKNSLQRCSCVAYGGRRHAYIPSEPHTHSQSSPDTWLCYPICQHKPCHLSPNLNCLSSQLELGSRAALPVVVPCRAPYPSTSLAKTEEDRARRHLGKA